MKGTRPKRTLWLLRPAAGSEPDPLDPLAPALPRLAQTFTLRESGPGRAFSLRALLRDFRLGEDMLIRDLTAAAPALDAGKGSRLPPALILLGASRPSPAVGPGAWARAAALASGDVGAGAIAALDAEIPGASFRLSRPHGAVQPHPPRLRLAAFGPPAALYAAMLAAGGAGGLRVVAPDAAGAARALALRDPLGLGALVEVAAAPHRADVARLAADAALILDLHLGGWPGLTDPLLAARAADRPAARIAGPLAALPALISSFVANPPPPAPAAPNGAAFAAALIGALTALQSRAAA